MKYIISMKEKHSVLFTSKKGASMKALKIHGVKYNSRSAYARDLLAETDMSDSEIARAAGIRPQTVYQEKMKMFAKPLNG